MRGVVAFDLRPQSLSSMLEFVNPIPTSNIPVLRGNISIELTSSQSQYFQTNDLVEDIRFNISCDPDYNTAVVPGATLTYDLHLLAPEEYFIQHNEIQCILSPTKTCQMSSESQTCCQYIRTYPNIIFAGDEANPTEFRMHHIRLNFPSETTSPCSTTMSLIFPAIRMTTLHNPVTSVVYVPTTGAVYTFYSPLKVAPSAKAMFVHSSSTFTSNLYTSH